MCWMATQVGRNVVALKDLRTWDVARPEAIDPLTVNLLEIIGGYA